MSYDVHITDQAEEDLRSIYAYIAFQLHSVENASAQLNRLEGEIYSLDQFPDRYRLYEKEPWYSRGVRRFPVDHYCVFYLPNKETMKVDIIRVLYAGRDIDRIMAETEQELTK